jgi:hypothetical protein
LLATETDRFIRHPNYHSKLRPLLQARDVDLQNLKGETTGVTLLTLLHPDATPHDARSAQIKRGQQEKGCKGGRPPKRELGYKKQRRRKQLLRVLQLHDAGESHRKIAIVTGVPSSTVWRWIDGWT